MEERTIHYRFTDLDCPVSLRKAHKCFYQAMEFWARFDPRLVFVEATHTRAKLNFIWEFHPRFSDNKIARCIHTGNDHWLLAFDPRVTWAAGPIKRFFGMGECLLTIAAHEIGHALRLPHSNNSDSVMYPEPINLRLDTKDTRLYEEQHGPNPFV